MSHALCGAASSRADPRALLPAERLAKRLGRGDEALGAGVALEERERLLAGCDISTEVGFKKHLDALRVHVITVSEIGAKDGRFRGEKYF